MVDATIQENVLATLDTREKIVQNPFAKRVVIPNMDLAQNLLNVNVYRHTWVQIVPCQYANLVVTLKLVIALSPMNACV